MTKELKRGQPFTRHGAIHCKCFVCNKDCELDGTRFPAGWRAVTHVISRVVGDIPVVEGIWVCSVECSRAPAVEQWRVEQATEYGAEPEAPKATGEYTTTEKYLDSDGDYPLDLLDALADLPQPPNDVVEADKDL